MGLLVEIYKAQLEVARVKIRICKKCKKELPETTQYFHKHKLSPNGLYASCIECEKERSKNYNKSARKKISERKKKYWEEKKEERIKYRREYLENLKENVIYKITCPDGKYYIGSTTRGISVRLIGHFAPSHRKESLAAHLHKNGYTRKDIKKEIIQRFETGEEKQMRHIESDVIVEHISDPLCLNKINTIFNGDR